MIDRAFSEDVTIAVPSHSMNHYFFRALEKAGRYQYAPRLFAGWQAMLDNHCWTRESDTFTLEVVLPTSCMEAEIILPNGEKHLQTGEKSTYVCKIG